MTVRVTPPATHHVKLYRGSDEVGLVLCDAYGRPSGRNISRRPYPSTATVKMQQGEQEYSDAEPPFSPKAQKDWSGGRGNLFLEDDASRFYDSKRLSTFVSGRAFLAGQETYTSGYRNAVQVMPGSMTWQGLYGADRYRSRSFVGQALDSVDFDAASIEIWVRKVGSPGTLTAAIYSNDGGSPGTLLQSGTLTGASVTDILSELVAFTLGAAQDINHGTTYHIVIFGAATDTETDHWEIGVDAATAGKKSTDGDAWAAATSAPYFRVLDADRPFTALFADYKGQLYFATRPDDGSAGKLYMNGYRGIAGDNALNLSKLYDASQSGFANWTTDWRVSIYDGQGCTEPQNWRKVTAGASGELTVSPPWNLAHLPATNPTDYTQYNVLGTNIWNLRSTLTFPVTDLEVTGELMWLASGEGKSGTSVRHLRRYWEGRRQLEGTYQWGVSTGTDYNIQASFLKAIYDPNLGYVLYLARNNDADEDVSVTRVLAPTEPGQDLLVIRPYRSASPNGFMTELQDTLTDLASDSFNRADGAIGATDGLADPAHTGGAGLAWTVQTGTFAIFNNTADCASLTGGKAITTVNAGAVDVTAAAWMTRVGGSLGLVLRYVDLDNYVFVVHTGTHVKLYKRVGGTDTELLSQAVTYQAGGTLKAECAGTRFRVYYQGVKIGGDVSITDAILQAGTNVGLYSTNSPNYWDAFWCYSNAWKVTVTGASKADIEIAPSIGTGLAATDTIATEDWRRYNKLLLNIKSTKAMAAGELQLVVYDSSGAIGTYNFRELAADKDYKSDDATNANIEFDLSAVAGADEVVSVGLNVTVAPTEPYTISVSFLHLDPGEKNIPIGDKASKITGLQAYGDPKTCWVLKEDSVWEIKNNIAHDVPIPGMESMKSSDNGRAHMHHDVYLYFSFGQGLERYYRERVDDIGPNRDEGMPADRQGPIVHSVAWGPGSFHAIDGGYDNYSSVLFYNESGWHEVYRAPRVGLRIRRIHIQPLDGTGYARLWISQGSDVIWVPIALNPLTVSSFRYTHEGVLETSRIAYQRQDIVKYFHSLKLMTEGLTANVSILAQYRTDTSTAWTSLPSLFTTSPSQEVDLTSDYSASGKWIQFRLIFRTNDNSLTPELHATVLGAIVQEDVKWAYQLSFRIADQDVDLLGVPDNQTASQKLALLDTWMRAALPVQMTTQSGLYTGKWVKPQPASLRHQHTVEEPSVNKVWDSEICDLVLLEV